MKAPSSPKVGHEPVWLCPIRRSFHLKWIRDPPRRGRLWRDDQLPHSVYAGGGFAMPSCQFCPVVADNALGYAAAKIIDIARCCRMEDGTTSTEPMHYIQPKGASRYRSCGSVPGRQLRPHVAEQSGCERAASIRLDACNGRLPFPPGCVCVAGCILPASMSRSLNRSSSSRRSQVPEVR